MVPHQPMTSNSARGGSWLARLSTIKKMGPPHCLDILA